MKKISRRRMLFGARAKGEEKAGGNTVQQNRLLLGRLAGFPVHSKTTIRAGNQDYALESLPEGLRFMHLESRECFALSLLGDGTVFASCDEKWPANAVLSVLTGEQYKL